jgi:beta-phosphoglucomutase-like phosphatase (HAD superfamily)
MEKTVPQLVNTMLSRYDAVLLDIDGTLVDSNGAHAAAWSDAFAAHGRHHPPEQVRPLIGKGGDKLLRELASLDDEALKRASRYSGTATCRLSSPRPARPRSSSGSWNAA